MISTSTKAKQNWNFSSSHEDLEINKLLFLIQAVTTDSAQFHCYNLLLSLCKAAKILKVCVCVCFKGITFVGKDLMEAQALSTEKAVQHETHSCETLGKRQNYNG